MTARHHARGRNHWHSDGRAFGHGARMASEAPSWRRIAFWWFVGLVLVPAFLSWCGSIRL